MDHAGRGASKSSIIKAVISVTIAGLISGAHHIYGAFVYETPWRLVVSLWIPAFVLLILAMLFLMHRYAYRTVASVAAWIVLFGGVIFQAGFTTFESVYSHVLKNILFFLTGERETFLQSIP